MVDFRGRRVLSHWPRLLQEAQKALRYPGLKHDRVPHDLSRGSQCHDCCALPGELHVQGCDDERCGDCGLQSCACGCGQYHRHSVGEKTSAAPKSLPETVSHEAARGLLDDLIAGRGGVVNRELLARYIDEQERR